MTGVSVALTVVDQAVNDDGRPAQGWYLVYTKPRSETLAAAQLARQGYDAYLPLYKTFKRGPGGMVAEHGPMFPRYVFFRPGSAGQSIAPVRSTVGVSNLVRFGVTPATVSSDLLDALRAFEQQREQADPSTFSPFQPGRRVLVCAGPLKGLEGLVSRTAGQRVTVLLDMLGQGTPVGIAAHDLEVLAA
jgi:transcriptional antiterminator RfaH